MTNEQREAINRLEKRIKDNEDYKTTQVWLTDDVVATQIVLSLIKEQQEEIEGLKNKEVLIKRYFKKCDLIKQKDKQIDLMADKLVEAYEWFYSEFDNFTKEDFIEYFETKAKKGE